MKIKLKKMKQKIDNFEKNIGEIETKYKNNLIINTYGLRYKNAINQIMHNSPKFFSKDMNKVNNYKKRVLKREIIYLDCEKTNNKLIKKYNKIINEPNKSKDNKILNDKESPLKKIQRNNSMSILKDIEEKKDKNVFRSYDKTNNNVIITNSKSYNHHPFSNNMGNYGPIVRKYIQKEFKRNSLLQNFEFETN